VSVVARRYDVNTNLVFTWRKRFGADTSSVAAPQFLPVMVTPDKPSSAPPSCNPGIEIEHPRGYRIRLSSDVKAAALRLVLDVLDRR
jgi:transposase